MLYSSSVIAPLSNKSLYFFNSSAVDPVETTADALNVRTGPGTNYPIASHKNHCIRDKGKYTIVEGKGNWGRLKSGAGWICLDYTKKLKI